MKLAFLGTPDAAVPPLRALVAAGHDIRIVVTRADKRRGRGSATSPSPVKQAALELGLPVTHQVDDVLETDVELGVVVAFGQLIKPHVLARVPMVNLHFSLLPRWRGAAPVERAILAGDDVTGVCVMQVEEGLDTGGTYACAEVPISSGQTAEELRGELVAVGTTLLVDALARPLSTPAPQIGEPTYAAKLTADDLHIDWSAPVDVIDRVVRVGGAWTTFRGDRVKVLGGHADGDRYQPDVVQPAGRAPMAFDSWRNGARPGAGEWFV